MFDFAWTEIALIGVVALVAIGPKDMPGAIKAVANMVKKARRMAGEFQTHVDEMVREANLDEVRNQINELRSMDVKGMVEKAVDGDGSIRQGFSNPMTKDGTATPATPQEGRVLDRPAATVVPPAPAPDAPAFVPPEVARRAALMPLPAAAPAPAAPPVIPAFVPPNLGMPSYAGLGAAVETTPLPAHNAPSPSPSPPLPSPSAV